MEARVAIHHDELHRAGAERDWWRGKGLDPLPVAAELWKASRDGSGQVSMQGRMDAPSRQSDVLGAAAADPHSASVGFQWKLRRIEKAEIVFLEDARAIDFEQFLRELDDSEFRYIGTLLTRECPEKIVQTYEAVARSIASAVIKEDANYTQSAEKLHTHTKRYLEGKLKPFLTINDTMYGALVEISNPSPHGHLDQMRRLTARIYLAYVDKLSKLQESRLTVNLAEQAVAPATVTKFRTVRLENRLGQEGAANQYRQETGSISQTDAAPLSIPKTS